MLPQTPAESGGLEDAMSNADLLADIALPRRHLGDALGDTGPWAVHYEPRLDATSDVHDDVLNLAPKRFSHELRAHHELGLLIEQGGELARMLYAWRCCSIAVPQIKAHDQPNRIEIYQKTMEVLEPEMAKIRQLLHYQRAAMNRFCEEVKRVSAEDGSRMEYVSDTLYLTLARMLDTFAILEEVKNIKTSLRNDYSTYRRAVEIVTRPNTATAQEAQELSLFLGTHNVFRSLLKDQLQKVPNYEDVLVELVNTCLRMLEGELFLFPEEKFALVKAVGFGLYLVDGYRVNINKMEGKRRVNLSKVDKLFKEVEVVPLYGDMAIAPFRYIETTSNYDESRWSLCTDTARQTGQSDIISHVVTLRISHNRLLGDLALIQKDIAQYHANKEPKTPARRAVGHELDRNLVSLSLRILKLLAEMSTRVQELVSWKLLHPTDIRENPNCPQDAEEYEKATRYNYNKEEKNALVEVIALLKGAHAQVAKMSTCVAGAMKRCAHVRLQELVQRHIRHALRKAIKHKRDLLRGVLVIVHLLSAELSASDKNVTIEAILEGNKTDENVNVRIPENAGEPGQTRLLILRTLLESLVEKTSSKKTYRRDLESQHVTAIENFLKSSFLWPHMFYYADSLHRCCNLSQLWYKEFYIEMSLGKRIQFPIQMSLPWILTDHVLEQKDTAMMEHLLSPMELYNDSANFALQNFRRQYMYDEIEAEVNLCLDQLVFKLSEKIFAHYKHLAACIFLNKKFKSLCVQYGLKIPSPPATRYSSFLRQCDMQLLGQTIDLRRLLTQRLNVALHKSADIAIARFECADLTGVVELVGLLEVNKLTHNLISEHVTLDPFSSMLREANHSVVTACGRVPLYIFLELNNDFLPHYCYNAATNRFVRTTFPLAEVIEREKPPSVNHAYLWGTKSLALCFGTIYAQFNNFFGPPHLEAICQLLGYQDIAIVLKHVMEVTKELIQCSLAPYVKALREVMPKKIIQPRFEYGSQGVLSYYLAQLNDILLYSDLQPKVYQGLREIGNALIFSLLMTQTLSKRESNELKHAGPFQHIIPKPTLPKKEKETKEEREAKLTRTLRHLETKYRNIHVSSIISKFGFPEQRDLVLQSDILAKEKLCTGLSIFESVLKSLGSSLSQMDWSGDDTYGGFLSMEDNKEFYRLWSALHLVYCMPPRSAHECTVEQLFGEGLQWAGCAIVCLLGQQRRFEALDFCYHLLKVNRMDKNTEVCKGVDMRRMIDRIRKFQILNAQIFHVINKYGREGAVPAPTILDVQPPTYDPEREAARGTTSDSDRVGAAGQTPDYSEV